MYKFNSFELLEGVIIPVHSSSPKMSKLEEEYAGELLTQKDL